MLYPIEHMFKELCISNTFEMISKPGDDKIIEMNHQVTEGLNWINTCRKRMQTGQYDVFPIKTFNFNLDMTKWSPKDNILKYIFVITSLLQLIQEEKLYMIACLLRQYQKKLYIDPEVIRSSKRSQEGLKVAGITADCVFKEATQNYKTAYFNVKENWFQGIFNYMSSFLHAGLMSLWEICVRERFNTKLKVQSNTHSDDNQTTLYIMTSIEDDQIVKYCMTLLTSLCKGVTFEPSIKKNYVSTVNKEFVSQINIGGEQKFLWVKPLCSMVIGIPYTTIKDVSSVHSKAAEALSKGAPAQLVANLINVLSAHIKHTYGVSNYHTKNLFSHDLGVKEEWLPMALGNSKPVDLSILGVLGPSSMDICTIYNICLLYTSRCV